MQVRLLYNLQVDNGEVMVAGTYTRKEKDFPNMLQREIQQHRDGTQQRTTLEIIQEDPKPAKSSPSKKRKR